MSHDATIEPPESFDAFQRRLIDIEPHLPKRLRQAAAYALEHPDEFALGTASALARNAEVQASTLVRFAQTLGFAGFSELQSCSARACATAGRIIPSAFRRCRRTPATAAIRPIFCSASPIPRRPRSRGCATMCSGASLTRRSPSWPRARTILCLGQRRSFCVAHYLTYALSQLGVPCSLIDNVGGLGPEQLAQADAGDALIAVSFSPYAPFTVELAKRAQRAGVPIVAITDSALSPLAGLADVRFEVVESDFGSFRSLSATFCLAMTLAVAVGEKRAEAA